jgi:hypothetical protein
MMRRAWRWVVVMLVMGLALGACGMAEDVRTVDEAITLLQKLEDNGAWRYLQDGIEALNNQDGYRARVRWQDTQSAITLTLTRDAQGRGWAALEQDGQTSRYFIDGAAVYHQRDQADMDGGYMCADDAPLLQDGVAGILTGYRDAATGLQSLSVVTDATEDSLLEREATRYEVISTFPDAVAILDQYDNAQLRDRVVQAGDFDLSGTLVIDDATDALLRFESHYRAPDVEVSLSFAVTQWGDVPPVQPPDIAVPCQP